MTAQEVQDTIEKMAQRIAQQFDPDLIVLFGSYAKGIATLDSDLDILVVLPVEGSVRQTACAIDALLSDRVLPVDLIVLTPEQFERQKDRSGTIACEAVREGKIIYERAA
ncbi:MAG TPA: nucleotidyltransferase domain-containing protein [bacterium]|nr:nucleotidyltransferase domain-containing protein [bacterium]